MDARGIMEPVDPPQPVSRQELRHQRKEMKKEMKPTKKFRQKKPKKFLNQCNPLIKYLKQK